MNKDTLSNLNKVVKKPIPEDQIQIIEEDTSIGPVDIYLMDTGHAKNYALVHVPQSKTVFQADHYNQNGIHGDYLDMHGLADRKTIFIKYAIDRLA